MGLLIGLDFDNTFTKDPKFWIDFIKLCENYGHKVVCVSSRRDSQFDRDELSAALPANIDIFLVANIQKNDYMKAAGYKIDIWIDDSPEYIPSNIIRIT